MAAFFSDYSGGQVDINADEFEQELEINYMYTELFTVSADVEDDSVSKSHFSSRCRRYPNDIKDS